MGIALTGREFTDGDTSSSPKVAIVNEKFARHFFGTTDVLGRRVGFDAKKPDEYEIVGVVRDTKYWRLRAESPRSAFVPISQSGSSATVERLIVVVRTAGDPERMISTLQREMQQIASDVPVRSVATMTQTLENAMGRERLLAMLSSVFGGLALLLACIGLYGVLSYAVLRRTTEIGIRVALGARRVDVIHMVLRDSVRLVGAGMVIGLIAALLSARVVESQLFALAPTDPAAFTIACVVLASAATVAALLPAWRAARVDPMIALRQD
jgi:predicted permease